MYRELWKDFIFKQIHVSIKAQEVLQYHDYIVVQQTNGILGSVQLPFTMLPRHTRQEVF